MWGLTGAPGWGEVVGRGGFLELGWEWVRLCLWMSLGSLREKRMSAMRDVFHDYEYEYDYEWTQHPCEWMDGMRVENENA